MSNYNLRPYIGNIPMIGGYNLSPYILDPLWKQFGAVAFYDFTDFSKIQPGATSVDVAGWDDTTSPGTFDLDQGTAAAQPVFNTDHIVFNGIDYLESLPPQTGDFTYIIKFMSTSSNAQILMANSSNQFRHISLTGETLRYKSANADVNFPLVYNNTGPHTVAIVRSGTNVKMYLAGIEVSNFTDIAAITLDELGDRSADSLGFMGNMYNVSIFPAALSEADVITVTEDLSEALSLGATNIYNFTDSSKAIAGSSDADVAGWKDDAGTDDLVQLAALNQASLVKSHITFDGTDHLEGLPPQTGDFTYIIKYKQTDAANISLLLGTSSSPDQVFYINGDAFSYRADDSTLYSFVAGADLQDGATRTVALVLEGVVATVYLDGAILDSQITTNQTFQPDLLGNFSGNTLQFEGEMYKVPIFSRALSASEVKAISESL